MISQRSTGKKVSVILPVYNSEAHVEIAVKSVLSQSFPDFELVAVDDGSTDNTSFLLKKFAEKDSRVQVITLAHAGVARAMNAGMEAATGKYIARMDADDVMHELRLEKQIEFLEANENIGVVSSLVKHGGDASAQEGYRLHVEWLNTLIMHEEIFRNRFVDSPVANPSVMFRRELVEKFGGNCDGNFPEDYEMWLRWMDHGVRFEKIPEVLLTWNDPPTRLTRNDERYSPENFNRIKAGYLARHVRAQLRDREVWLCGAGRVTRKRSDFFLEEKIPVAGYIDIDKSKAGKFQNHLPVISVEGIPPKEKSFIVSFVASRGAREEIRKWLRENKFEEGRDFVLAG